MPAKWPVVLASANQKGGCAKTSSIFHVGAAYARLGLRVLWVDLDPQGSLTRIVYPGDSFDGLLDCCGVAALLGQMDVPRKQLVHPGSRSWEKYLEVSKGTISLMPATKGLRTWNFPCGLSYDSLGFCLHQWIAEMADDFDVVLVDTPPNLELLTMIGLLAADGAYTPAAPEDFDIDGIKYVEDFIAGAMVHNPTLRWLGVVKAKVQPRLSVHVSYAKDLAERYGVAPENQHSKLFTTVLPLHAAFKDAVWAKIPLPLWKPATAGAKTIIQFAEELAERTGFTLPPLPKPQRKSKKKAA